MTDSKPPNIFARLREPAALNYLILLGVGILVYFLIMSAKGNDAGAFLAVLLAVLGVLLGWGISPFVILLMTTYLLYDPAGINLFNSLGGGPWLAFPSPSRFEIEDGLLAAALMAYLIGHFRLKSIVDQAMPLDLIGRRRDDSTKPVRRPLVSIAADELPKSLAMGAACVVAGQCVWLIFKAIERSNREQSIFPESTAKLILVTWVIGGGLLLASAILTYLRTNQLSPLEAELLLRDVAFQEMKRETDRLHRWRNWYKNKAARNRTLDK